METLSRDIAELLGVETYFTGAPCRNAHVAARRVRDGKCVECVREKKRRYRRKHPHKHLSGGTYARQRRITEATRPCPARCECCGREPNGHNGTMHFDHDHETGEFRGWLCHSCNTGLGHLGDSIEGVKRALAYLWRFAQSRDRSSQGHTPQAPS